MPIKLVEVTRGSIVESKHRGDLAVFDHAGSLLAHAGNPGIKSYLRSAAKPIQALQVILSGAADRFAFMESEIAIMCASHYAQPEHVKTVRSILAKIGLDESFLLCGDATSLSAEYALQLARQGLPNSPVLSDCSGKHAGMLALCVHKGWPLDSYTQPDHPLQRENKRIIAMMGGCREDTITVGVDGCTVPVFALSLRCMATAYARLANPERLPKDLKAACRRVFSSMVSAPQMIAGTGGFCTELIGSCKDKLIGKLGAEGVYCVGIAGKGIGIALKFEDGSTRGISAVVVSVLEDLGLLSKSEIALLSSWKCKPVLNDVGKKVGEIRPSFALARD